MSEPCLRFNRDGFQPDHEQQLSEVERGFDSYVRARKKSIEVFRLAAVRLDGIAQVRKGLKIGGFVTCAIGKLRVSLGQPAAKPLRTRL